MGCQDFKRLAFLLMGGEGGGGGVTPEEALVGFRTLAFLLMGGEGGGVTPEEALVAGEGLQAAEGVPGLLEIRLRHRPQGPWSRDGLCGNPAVVCQHRTLPWLSKPPSIRWTSVNK